MGTSSEAVVHGVLLTKCDFSRGKKDRERERERGRIDNPDN